MDIVEGSFGRIGYREERYPNGMFKYNREHMSYQDIFTRKREEGDLYAVFQDEMGGVGVEYSRREDFESFALDQIRNSARLNNNKLDVQDFFMLIGSTMISRIHDYDFENFIHLLDHDLKQVFDQRRLIEWVNMNVHLFSSPAEQAVLADADDRLGLEEEMEKLERVGRPR